MDGQNEPAQRLPEVVSVAEMLALVGQNVAGFRFSQSESQINFRPKQSRHAGGADPVAVPDPRVRFVPNGEPKPPPEPQIGQDAVADHDGRAGQPDPRQYGQKGGRLRGRGRAGSGDGRTLRAGRSEDVIWRLDDRNGIGELDHRGGICRLLRQAGRDEVQH